MKNIIKIKNNKKPRLSVIGLGKLGICTAVCFSSKGYKVLGLDINKKTVNLVNKGIAPGVEPRLQELIDKSKGNLRTTLSPEEVIKDTDISFFIVPTPSKTDGNFSDKFLVRSLKPLSLSFRKKKDYHLFVIVSTVSPGTIEEHIIPLIEKYSNKKLNKDFGVCYNPEFIALGGVINGLLKPDMVLIGESNEKVGQAIEKLYRDICENTPYIARMSIISAEITKISLNAYVTMKISFANALGNICEKIPNTEIGKITRALGADKRVSPYYLKSGLAYGGPCFPRDNKAFTAFGARYGVETTLAKATDKVNKFQIKHLIKKVLNYVSKNKKKKISILGLAYKPDTPVIEESPVLKLIQGLLRYNIKVIVYDPLALTNVKKIFGNKIYYSYSLKDCLSRSSFWIITTQAEEFKKINRSYIKENPTIIFDCWRILEPKRLGGKVKYIALGEGS